MPLLNKKIKNYIFIKILYTNLHFIKKKGGKDEKKNFKSQDKWGETKKEKKK